jgi:hypothetical protein
MRVRGWEDILQDVIGSDADPDGWRAVAGDRASGLGEDMFVGHPREGLYQMKTYARNPFDVEGVGTQVARNLDDEIGSYLPEDHDEGLFAINRPPEDESEAEAMASRLEEVIKTHAEAPTEPEHVVEDVLDAMDSPAFGPIEYDQYDRPEPLADLSGTFEEAQEVLDAELDDLIEDDGVGRGFQ